MNSSRRPKIKIGNLPEELWKECDFPFDRSSSLCRSPLSTHIVGTAQQKPTKTYCKECYSEPSPRKPFPQIHHIQTTPSSPAKGHILYLRIGGTQDKHKTLTTATYLCKTLQTQYHIPSEQNTQNVDHPSSKNFTLPQPPKSIPDRRRRRRRHSLVYHNIA